MGTQKLSEVGQNSRVSRITSDPTRTIVQAQPKDTVSVSKKTQVSKTEELKETAKMLNFKRSLEKLADSLKNEVIDSGTYRPYGVNFLTKVVGPYKLTKMTKGEIVKKLLGNNAVVTAPLLEGEDAFCEFEHCQDRLLGDYPIWKAEAMGDIRNFFKNNDFSKIIFIGNYLAGITKGKQIIGIIADCHIMTEWD